jgi:hypothetical protein
MKSEDVLILLKIAATRGLPWTEDYIASETGHEVAEVKRSLETLRTSRLIVNNQLRDEEFKDFILFRVHNIFPARPGEIVRGICTGAKPGQFFTGNLPYTPITVWPYEHGKEMGYRIHPLSPHCCFAALNDPQLRKLLAITETMRIVGREARPWAASELSRFFELQRV